MEETVPEVAEERDHYGGVVLAVCAELSSEGLALFGA